MLIRVKLAFEYFQIARRSIQPICPSWQRVLNLFEVAAVRSIYHIVPIRNRTHSTFGSASDYIEWLSETIRCVLKLIGICFFDAEFKIVQFEGLNPVLEFLALRGRSYSVIGSDDLVTWVPVSFQVQSALASGKREPLSIEPIEAGASDRACGFRHGSPEILQAAGELTPT